MIKAVVKTILVCLAISYIGLGTAVTAPTIASEYEVKAAFLYNFLKFVEWPPKVYPDQSSPIFIGILGDDPFLDSSGKIHYLQQAVAEKIINNRRIVIQRSDRIADLKNCQIIFVNKAERNRVKEILGDLGEVSILTVGESDNFCRQGGAVNFVMQSEKVRFEINVEAAEKAGLKISSKLLNVATIVRTQNK